MIDQITSLKDKEYGQGATDREIADAEHALGVRFPKSYKAFLSRFGLAEFSFNTLYGLGADVPQGYTLVKNALCERYEAHPHIPLRLVPIMNDGAGNNYCLDTSTFRGEECPIVFWDHEHEDGPDQIPEIVSPSFDSWLIDRIVNSPHADDV